MAVARWTSRPMLSMMVNFDSSVVFNQPANHDASHLTVNVLKGKTWNDQSEFDATKDKAQFRQYEDACDRVKNFYKEQHGKSIDPA
jgi:hypothetical protein